VPAKARADMILEPMQVMIQLALLAHYPIGAKLRVANNTLYIQGPTSFQGLTRWWASDNKDDLYYLFHAIRRYYKWYADQEDELDDEDQLGGVYAYIMSCAIKGIDRLIETYSGSDKLSIRHTLSLYKNVLDLETPAIFKDDAADQVTMDNVFQGIRELYTEHILSLVYSSLLMLEEEENEAYKTSYLLGLDAMLTPLFLKIRKWITEKLTC